MDNNINEVVIIDLGNWMISPDLYDDFEPRSGGLMDPRLGGGSDDGLDCVICGLSMNYCHGHDEESKEEI